MDNHLFVLLIVAKKYRHSLRDILPAYVIHLFFFFFFFERRVIKLKTRV